MTFYDALAITQGPEAARRARAHAWLRAAIRLAERSEQTTADARRLGDAGLMQRAFLQSRAAVRALRLSETHSRPTA